MTDPLYHMVNGELRQMPDDEAAALRAEQAINAVEGTRAQLIVGYRATAVERMTAAVGTPITWDGIATAALFQKAVDIKALDAGVQSALAIYAFAAQQIAAVAAAKTADELTALDPANAAWP